eukprot:scaffold212089_cov19-Tisochrysis_lutea.AAC.1
MWISHAPLNKYFNQLAKLRALLSQVWPTPQRVRMQLMPDLDKEKVRTSVPGAVLSEGAIMPYPALDCTYPAHYPCCPALLPHSSYHPALDRRTLARVQEVCDAVASIRRT